MKAEYFDVASPDAYGLEMAPPPTATIPTETIHVALKARKQLRRHFMTLPGPLLLFFAFIAMVLTHTPIHQVYMADHGVATELNPKAADVVPSKTVVSFMKIRALDDIPKWINNSVLPSVFQNVTINGTIVAGRISSYNQLVGAVDVSVFNMPKTACQSSSDLKNHYGPCVDFELDSPIDGPVENLRERNLRRFPWYTMYIPISNLKPYDRFKRWQVEGTKGGYYLSPTTKEVLVKITTYNGQLDLFTYQVFKVEVEEGGACSPTYKVQSIPTNPYSTSHINIVMDAIVGLLVLQVLGRRLWMLARQFRGKDPWSCDIGTTFIEWCSIVIVVLYYAAWIQVCNKFFNSDLDGQIQALDNFYTDLYKLPETANVTTAPGQYNQRDYMGNSTQPNVSDIIDSFGGAIDFVYIVSIIACLQLVVHVLAAFQFHPTMNVLTNTIVSSVKRLGSFLFIFLLVVMALATSGCLLFGPQLEEFSRLDKSMVTCINMLFGGYSYDLIKDVNDLAVVWFWVSQSIVTLVLVNIMLAVVITSHQEIVDINLGKRSFVDEFFLVMRDVIKIYILRRPDLFKKLTNRMEIESHTVWTTKDVALGINITEPRAERLISKLKHYAASVDVEEPVRGVNQITAALDRAVAPSGQSADAKMQEMDAKLAFLVECMKQQQQRLI
ncbi:hypothetical protein SDRG_14030 [Saprolegnia diclina VS20]|uniref:Polycystin cation channel PKD1/PKD2 domain-containing protein n=1 Tax=Saprolegnia diclina (strain VS20) TaxID=1156394 RepID=T0Q0W1_SAPDV|nr:hypothetical protein SDRG_14030 [Saprolegnia diclina VS20]EQC28206.1 hypothetical protein SDRG_14030 [Saprolegnia diclina VS20]|eukprot:XP_008618355.1 hypothetical protein SDRG_14030 [Saprolegnia diclina VS20]